MSTYEISKSSLLSLKAEILKKQEELIKAKAENDIKIKVIKKNTPLEFKNKGVESRNLNDLDDEEKDLLKLSRSKLEAKSRLYDKLLKDPNDVPDDISRRYLVRFDNKRSNPNDIPPDADDEPDKYPESEDDATFQDDYEVTDPSDDWVEYVDCLGRSRTCLKKDLEYLKSKDEELRKTVEEKKKQHQAPVDLPEPPEKVSEIDKDDDAITVASVESELISGNVRREVLRRQWEEEEEQLKNKTSIHYQNVLFDEARTHGVGYYSFSKDEEERAKQQEALNKLREETQAKQKKAQELKALREKQLAARLKAARDRKRARLGLPPEEETEPIIGPPAPSEEENNKKESEESEKEKELELMRKTHVRPWDIGKEGVKEHYVLTQEEWNEKKREERPAEFAPPKSYAEKPKKQKKKRSKPKKTKGSQPDQKPLKGRKKRRGKGKIKKTTASLNASNLPSDVNHDNRGMGAEIPPPSSLIHSETEGNGTPQLNTPKSNVADSFAAGLEYLRQKEANKPKSQRDFRGNRTIDCSEDTNKSLYFSTKKPKMDRNVYQDSNDFEDDDRLLEEYRKISGYDEQIPESSQGSSVSGRKRTVPLEESIEKGLKLIRKQVEASDKIESPW